MSKFQDDVSFCFCFSLFYIYIIYIFFYEINRLPTFGLRLATHSPLTTGAKLLDVADPIRLALCWSKRIRHLTTSVRGGYLLYTMAGLVKVSLAVGTLLQPLDWMLLPAFIAARPFIGRAGCGARG